MRAEDEEERLGAVQFLWVTLEVARWEAKS